MDILYFTKSAKGYQYGLIILDLYSLYISIYPLKMKGSAEVAKNLNAYFAAHGPPLYIYNDNDPSFWGKTEKILRLINVTLHKLPLHAKTKLRGVTSAYF
jgi:hypothetical protein